VTPGDTLYGIATAHHDSLPDEEADNAQIANPALLFPGQVVFSPGHSPVNATTTAQIQAAEQADAALADAPAGQPATRVAALQHATQQQWAEAQSDIANDLRAQARDKLLPDKVVQPTVNALNQWAVGSDKLRQATQAAYQQVYDEWQKQGVTSQQLAPVLQARQAAMQDEVAPSRLRAPANRAIVQARNLDYLPGIPFANTVPDYGDSTGDLPNPPASLRQLHYWAETIFGSQAPPTS
jgi:hypothetical protein